MAGNAPAGASGMDAFEAAPARDRPADASLCMTCPVRASCIGAVAGHVGTRALRAVLAGWCRLPAGTTMQVPAGALYAVRGGSVKSLDFGCDDLPLGFHFAGEIVGGGPALRLVALEDSELCGLRHDGATGALPGARGIGGRIWEMMSRELLREQALAGCLQDLAPPQRVFALVAALAARAGAHGPATRRVRLHVATADLAAFLRVAQPAVDETLAGLAALGALQPGVDDVGLVWPALLREAAGSLTRVPPPGAAPAT